LERTAEGKIRLVHISRLLLLLLNRLDLVVRYCASLCNASLSSGSGCSLLGTAVTVAYRRIVLFLVQIPEFLIRLPNTKRLSLLVFANFCLLHAFVEINVANNENESGAGSVDKGNPK
jgi:hypothetical protein